MSARLIAIYKRKRHQLHKGLAYFIHTLHGKLIVEGKFAPPGFAAPLGYKDIRLVLAAADDLRVPMPAASLLRDRFLTLFAHDGDKLDWSAVGQLAGRDSGTP